MASGCSARTLRRALVCVVALLACVAFPLDARADTYVWGGHVGRLRLDFVVPGFNEGAGTEGWTLESARLFARWSRSVNRLIPAGKFVEIAPDASGEAIAIRVRACPRAARCPGTLLTEATLARPPFAENTEDLGALRDAVARAVDREVPDDQRNVDGPVTLYTVQIYSSLELEKAERFAERVEGLSIGPMGEFFYQGCSPCDGRTTKVAERRIDGTPVHVVYLGIYLDTAAARRARDKLAARWPIRGVVVALRE